MAYEPLHHKYRPQSFAELVGQEAIATTLTNALRQQKIAPAYLFTGARGTGKTSSARILAKSLNCLKLDRPTASPCGVCEVCRTIANGSALDVIEIDAASNTGVDNIRDLIERAQFAPVQCRYKVYVIDECHMLSTQAFNALLKTLEEPPDRVVFVLATTDPQRVLPTIISRCQRFDFRRIELGAMVRHLSQIADQEAIAISPEALQLVGQLAQGGLRDAQSTLDQLSLLEGQITPDRVWDLVGAVPERDLLALVQAIATSDSTAVIDRLRQLMDRGREPLIVLQNLASFYRDLLIAKTTPDRHDLVAITGPTWQEMCSFVQSMSLSDLLKGQQHLRTCELQVKNTTQPRLWLEVALLGLLPQTPASAPASAPAVPPPSQLPRTQLPRTQPTKPPVSPDPATQPPAPSAVPLAEQVEQPEPRELEALETADDQAEPAPAEPKPAEPPGDSSVGSSVEIDLEATWQSILGVLQPPGTRELFRQQGRLLALSSDSARIGITSKQLLKMAQLRITNLEAACLQLNGQTVKVSLEVLTVATAPPAENGSRAIPQAGATGPQASRPGPSPVRSQPAPPPGPTPTTPTVSEPGNGYRPTQPPHLPTSPTPPSDWQSEDEVKRAAKSLAQMFNGQIVSTDETPAPEGLKLESSALEAELGSPEADLPEDLAEDPEGDPDADVPF